MDFVGGVRNVSLGDLDDSITSGRVEGVNLAHPSPAVSASLKIILRDDQPLLPITGVLRSPNQSIEVVSTVSSLISQHEPMLPTRIGYLRRQTWTPIAHKITAKQD